MFNLVAIPDVEAAILERENPSPLDAPDMENSNQYNLNDLANSNNEDEGAKVFKLLSADE